jgi:hypothetical protein
MNQKIIVPILFTVDVSCAACSCKREAVRAHRLPDGETYVFDDQTCGSCSHQMKEHRFVRNTKSQFEKKRDREI